MSQIDYGLVIKKSDTYYIVNIDSNSYYSGYGVVSKEEDPYGKYDLADVQAWAAENPDKVLTEHPLEAQMELQQQIADKEAQLAEVDKQIFDLMCQDFANRLQEVQTLPETEQEVLTLLTQKNALMQEIESLKQQIEAFVENLSYMN